MHDIHAAFAGSRVEALQALMSKFKVTTILCLEGSRAHKFSEEKKLPIKILKRNERDRAMDLFALLREQVILSAGFPWIIDKQTLNSACGLKINSHPSFLPDYKGFNSVRDAFNDGSRTLGVSLHHMTPEVDSGPVITQEKFSIEGLGLNQVYELIFSQVEPRVISKGLSMISPLIKDVSCQTIVPNKSNE
jgi:folate-dependent phosphoribosylglycinamide formyltransferase PurN